MDGRAEGGKQQKQGKGQRSLRFPRGAMGQGSPWVLSAAEMLPASPTTFPAADAKCYCRTTYWFTIPRHLWTTLTACSTSVPTASLQLFWYFRQRRGPQSVCSLPNAHAWAGTLPAPPVIRPPALLTDTSSVDGELEQHRLPPRLLLLMLQPPSVLWENENLKLTKERAKLSDHYIQMWQLLCPLGLFTLQAGTCQVLCMVVSANHPKLLSLCCFLTLSTGQINF